MRVSSAVASNILSFTPRTEEGPPSVEFRSPNHESGIHILVGPNGAGKSNILEIIAALLAATLNSTASIQRAQGETIASAMRETDRPRRRKREDALFTQNPYPLLNRLPPHYDHKSTPQLALLRVELGSADHADMESLFASRDYINRALALSGIHDRIDDHMSPADIKAVKGFSIRYKPDSKSGHELASETSLPAERLAFLYFRHFGFLETVFAYLRHDHGILMPILRRKFALLGGQRDAPGVSGWGTFGSEREVSFANIRGQRLSESVRSNSASSVFEYTRTRLAYAMADAMDPGDLPPARALERLRNSPTVMQINEVLRRHIGIELHVQYMRHEFHRLLFSLWDPRRDREVQLEELSSGQKSIVHLAFSLYGADVEHGIVVIDEPELHLHPHFQQTYLDLLREAARDLSLQILIATHAAPMVTSQTIPHILRVTHNPQTGTSISAPVEFRESPELVRTLDYSHGARTLFSSRVLLVEGETDEYFIRHLIRWLIARNKEPHYHQLRDLEVVSIQGKGQHIKYRTFFEGAGIKVSFLGDWDCLSMFVGSRPSNYATAYQRAIASAGADIMSKGSRDGQRLIDAAGRLASSRSVQDAGELRNVLDDIIGRRVSYPEMLRDLKEKSPEEYSRLQETIYELRKDGVFLLAEGELEDYLGVQKGLRAMIEFCESGFEDWASREENAGRDDIIELIRMAAGLYH